ncbi:MAG TPA: alkaline phosphatase family protein [Bryobacteraceae bacterium]|nr:alkaline phosphatase family protein [Bryobacteraceae bacterium]
MRKLLACLFALISLAGAAPKKPKLVLAVVIDQFRYDYLTRFRSDYTAGLNQLLTRGAVFSDAQYNHFPTVTAAGHSTFLSGAPLSVSGIIGNDWYDRDEGREVTSVSDAQTQIVGGRGGAGSSPRRLLVSTVGDELKIADGGKSKVIGVSLKDRSAILPAGHMANGAYWFDNTSGNFVSSTFYVAELPGWVKSFNDSHPAARFAGATWLNHKMPSEAKELNAALAASPFGNDLVAAFAERALEAEQLGKHDETDVLAVSFSSNDYVGHQVGPDAPEVREVSIRTDKVLGDLLAAADRAAGAGNVLVVLTADHGVAPTPEVNAARRMPGGRPPAGIFNRTAQEALARKYGDGKWILSGSEHSLYFNRDLIAEKKLDPAEVDRTAAEAVRQIPHVFRVYTREQLAAGAVQPDAVSRRVENGFYPRRSGDLEILLEPYWIFTQGGATHGTVFDYDTHVPVIFMGQGIKPGRYYEPVVVNDIAPTLAAILEIETPSGSAGRVLSEMFAE